jgi:lipoate---protein ligase
MPETWRLIPLLRSPGRVQMALDTWLLEQHRLGLHPPTLRFYTWSPAAISLGYHQRHIPEHWQHLRWQGETLELVRRPTGGRAVLHQGDLTYAVVMSAPKGSRIEVYRSICEFLIEGWRSLGVELHYGTGDRNYIRACNCFETATSADLVAPGGEKFIGSAQLRRGQAILQHGSICLNPNSQLFAQVFGSPVSAVPIAPFLSGEDCLHRVMESLAQAATRCFNVQFQIQPLSAAEWEQVHEALQELQS